MNIAPPVLSLNSNINSTIPHKFYSSMKPVVVVGVGEAAT